MVRPRRLTTSRAAPVPFTPPAPSLVDGVLTFWLPWDALVSDNRKYQFRFVLSDQYRHAKAATAQRSREAAFLVGWEKTAGLVAYHVTVTEPNRKRRDLNFAKAFGDAITEGGAVWVDDRQVRDQRWTFAPAPCPVSAGALVRVWALSGDAPPDAAGSR